MPTTAPACHISPTNQFDQPPAARTPNIPVPDGTIAGLLATVQALKNTVEKLQKPTNFSEDRGKRKTDKVKVVNPDDPEQFVEVERITHLEFVDRATGQRIVWSR